MGEIKGQESRSTSWIIRGDESGSYKISADFTGNLMPFDTPVSVRFETEKEFSVSTGEGLHIYIMPEKQAYIDEYYYVQFMIVNESDRPFYEFSTTIGDYREPVKRHEIIVDYHEIKKAMEEAEKAGGTDGGKKEESESPGSAGQEGGTESESSGGQSVKYGDISSEEDKERGIQRLVTDVPVNYSVSNVSAFSKTPVFRQGDSIDIAALMPGERFYGTYNTMFEGAGYKDHVYYELIDAAVDVWSGKNMGVKVTVIPIDGHISFENIVYDMPKTSFGDPVDLSGGSFTEEKDLMVQYGADTLAYELKYDSALTDAYGANGYGWHDNFSMSLEDMGGRIRLYSQPGLYTDFIMEESYNGVVNGSLISADSSSLNIAVDNSEGSTFGKYISLSAYMKDYAITKTEDGTYLLTGTNDAVYGFDSQGRLSGMKDESGRVVSLSHMETRTVITDETSGKRLKLDKNAEGLVTVISDDNGRHVYLSYENGCIKTITNENGEITTYYYDEYEVVPAEETEEEKRFREANAEDSKESDGAETDGTEETPETKADEAADSDISMKHKITSEVSHDGQKYVCNKYDSKGRVVSQLNGSEPGVWTEITYEETETGTKTTAKDEDGNVTAVYTDSHGRMTKKVNALGGETEYVYDDAGNLICEKNGAGNVVLKKYDEKGNITNVTDSTGNETMIEYDSHGNPVRVKDADGNKAQYSYNGKHLLLSMTDYSGLKTEYTYTKDGLPETETIAGLGTISYEYENGRPVKVTDRNGNISYMSYDGVGNLTKVKDALGNETSYTYDSAGRKLTETDAAGGVTSYRYDCNGNITSVKDAAGNVTEKKYNSRGFLIKEKYPDGTEASYSYNASGRNSAVTYADGSRMEVTYDAMGDIVSETCPGKAEITYKYDKYGQLVEQTDADKKITKYEYYPNGKIYKKHLPDGKTILYNYDMRWRLVMETDMEGHSLSYKYDIMDNVTEVRDGLGNTVSYEYDIYGRMVKEKDANGNETCYEYDSNGNCITKTNALNISSHMEYDACNRLTKAYVEKDGEEYAVQYRYDAMGRVTETKDEEGNTTKIHYDILGNVESTEDAQGNVTQTRTYDSMNRPETVTDMITGNVTKYHYDVMGNLTETVSLLNDATEKKTEYTYDILNRVTEVRDTLGGTVNITYDSTGNIKSLTDPNGGTSMYEYDSMGRLIREENAAGSIYTYTYNASGLLEEQKNAKNQKTEYEYDAAGRLTGFTDELGTVEYTYDNNGNVLTVSDENGTITRTYDELDRVKTYTDYKGNTVKYGYDELGNLITLTYPGGEIVRYDYYKNGLLKSVTDSDGKTTRYEYDGNGRLTKTERPDGTTEECSYDRAGRLVSKRDYKKESEAESGDLPVITGKFTDVPEPADTGITIISAYTYEYDAAGNIIRITGTENSSIDTEGGTAGGESAKSTGAGVDLSGLTSAEMSYDSANRLVEYNGQKVEYDADGNMTYGPLNGEMTEFQYDCRNRLISAGRTVYAYDAENTRISAETPEYTEEYITESHSSEYSRILEVKRYAKEEAETDKTKEDESATETKEEDRTESKAETIKYVYGNGLISQTDTNGCRYYHYNHLGSTMQLTDKDGNVTDRYTYGTYGELLSGDTEHTRFLYNGRYGVTTDENGLYYMRTRYYNTDIRRFINQDIITGSIGNSQSLNRYAYVQGNPVSYTDPFGLSPLNAMADTVGHAVLDLIGSIPVFGAPANILNCYWYYKEKNYEMAVMSGIAILPGVGQFIGAGLKAFKYTRAAQYIITTTKFAGSMANCMIAVGTCIDTGKRIYHDIRNGKFGLNVNTVANIATIGISAFAAAVSGKEMAGAGVELTNMVAEDLPEFGAKVDALLSRLKINNKGFTYLYQPKNNGNGIEGGLNSGYNEYDLVPYNNQKYRTPGYEKHHGVLNEWAEHNIPGYTKKNAPTILLSPEKHGLTKEVYREWLRKNYGSPVGVSPNWSTISKDEAMRLTIDMFDAANVPQNVRQEYFELFDIFIIGG